MADQLANAAGYLACGIAIAGTGLKLRLDRDRRNEPATRFALAFGLCIGTAMAVTAPATAEAARSLGPLPVLLTLIGDQLKLAAAGSLTMLAHSLNAPERAHVAVRRQRVLLAVTVALEVVAYLAAGITRVGDDVTAQGSGRLILVGYIALFTAYGIWCLAVFSLLVGRCAWDVPPGLLRLGLLLMSAGSAVGLAWLADNGRDMASVLATGGESAAESTYSALAALACVSLGFAGSVLSSWLGAWPSWRRPETPPGTVRQGESGRVDTAPAADSGPYTSHPEAPAGPR